MRAKGPESKDARQAVRSLVITHTGVVCECECVCVWSVPSYIWRFD